MASVDDGLTPFALSDHPNIMIPSLLIIHESLRAAIAIKPVALWSVYPFFTILNEEEIKNHVFFYRLGVFLSRTYERLMRSYVFDYSHKETFVNTKFKEKDLYYIGSDINL